MGWQARACTRQNWQLPQYRILMQCYDAKTNCPWHSKFFGKIFIQWKTILITWINWKLSRILRIQIKKCWNNCHRIFLDIWTSPFDLDIFEFEILKKNTIVKWNFLTCGSLISKGRPSRCTEKEGNSKDRRIVGNLGQNWNSNIALRTFE